MASRSTPTSSRKFSCPSIISSVSPASVSLGAAPVFSPFGVASSGMWKTPSTSELPAPERVQVDAEVRRERAVVRIVAQNAGQRLARRRDVLALPPDRARNVVLPAQLVEDRAADARGGEGAERQPAARVEGVQRVHQAHRAGADQLVELRLHRQAAGELPRHVVHESQVLVEQAVACDRVAAIRVRRPEGGGLHVGLQKVGRGR
jgi:hypothetical protein